MRFENAEIGEATIVEPGAEVGFRYHPRAGLARIGAHSIVRRGTLIYGDVSIGDSFQSGHKSTLEGLIRFGDGVRVMSHVYIPSRTWFGDRVFVGPGTNFLNERIPGRLDHGPTPRGATVEDDVMIGGGCTVLPGVTIGAQLHRSRYAGHARHPAGEFRERASRARRAPPRGPRPWQQPPPLAATARSLAPRSEPSRRARLAGGLAGALLRLRHRH